MKALTLFAIAALVFMASMHTYMIHDLWITASDQRQLIKELQSTVFTQDKLLEGIRRDQAQRAEVWAKISRKNIMVKR